MSPKSVEEPCMPRRDFLKHSVVAAGAVGGSQGLGQMANMTTVSGIPAGVGCGSPQSNVGRHAYDSTYVGEYLGRIAFPLGGLGAGMMCLEGTGSLSHVSLRHRPEVFHEPVIFAAICVKGDPNVARVLEGPVPTWKIFGPGGTGNGGHGKDYGLPRFDNVSFNAKFPFGTVKLADKDVPLDVEITGWSPFIPGDADPSSLPVAAMEYTLKNTSNKKIEAVFSFNTRNFMAIGHDGNGVGPIANGFVLWEKGLDDKPWEKGWCSITVDDPNAKVNHLWFRGSWFDPLTIAWKDIKDGACFDRPPVTEGGQSSGGTVFVPFKLAAGQEKKIAVRFAWYVPQTNLQAGKVPDDLKDDRGHYQPWYASKFATIEAVTDYWRDNYSDLKARTQQFTDTFYSMTLPSEVIEAIAANLTILKAPTVLRQKDGRLWCWEGCCDSHGCCHGSCTHVWNYAQAICHLFPDLERTLRETEFNVSQNDKGHQMFRSNLPILPVVHEFHAAADGQLGGIMKVHRDWRVSGDTGWLRKIWPKVKTSLDYCSKEWDPKGKGILEEPHHNTYDIEFWGPDGMCTSFYLGALAAAVQMGKALGDNVSKYEALLKKGRKYMESELFDGEYFIQKVQWEGLEASDPTKMKSMVGGYSPEAQELLKKEGPKYQYGKGCLSDGVLGAWIAKVCGVGAVLDEDKMASHLRAVHEHNLKRDLSDHANPQRPTFAVGFEGGLLLCSWPKGGELSLPFVYSDEVWTGIEYQVASHLMLQGHVEEGLEIVRVCRDRYDGRIRNPFNEYECGHWYARAMSSYGLLQGLTGVRYDAVDKTLTIEPNIKGDFTSFLSTATGYGKVGVKDGKPFLDVVAGKIDVKETKYAMKV